MPDRMGGDQTALRIEAFLRSKDRGVRNIRVRECRQLTSGVSHETYLLKVLWNDSQPVEREFILRVAPPEGMLPGLDVAAQFHILKALENTPVPVPRVYWLASEGEYLDRPFFIAEKVEGESYVTWNSVSRTQGAETMHKLRDNFVKGLADIHALDWSQLELPFLAVPRNAHDYALIELRRWRKKLGKRNEDEQPVLKEAALWLRRNAPQCHHPLILVHGDYRLMNLIVCGGAIKAVLDWEVTTIGDPIADLGMAAMKIWGRGFYRREEFLKNYAAYSAIRASPEELRYWEVMGYFKTIAANFRFIDAFRKGVTGDVRVAVSALKMTNYLQHLMDLIGES